MRRILVFVFAITLLLLFFLFVKKQPSSKPILNKSDMNINLNIDREVAVSFYEDHLPFRELSFVNYPNNIRKGQDTLIEWDFTQRLIDNKYNDSIAICLIAFNKNGQIVDTKNTEIDECAYRFSGSNYPLLLTHAPLESKKQNIVVPVDIEAEFKEIPEYYILQLIMMDSRDSTQSTNFEGMVGFVESGKIYIK